MPATALGRRRKRTSAALETDSGKLIAKIIRATLGLHGQESSIRHPHHRGYVEMLLMMRLQVVAKTQRSPPGGR